MEILDVKFLMSNVTINIHLICDLLIELNLGIPIVLSEIYDLYSILINNISLFNELFKCYIYPRLIA